MKYRSIAVITLLICGTLLNLTAQDCDEAKASSNIKIPLYAMEFAMKFGVKKTSLTNMIAFSEDIKKAIAMQGLGTSVAIATSAMDSLNEKKYFLILNDTSGTRIMRYYVLSDSIISLNLYFLKDKNGAYSDVIFSEGYINGE